MRENIIYLLTRHVLHIMAYKNVFRIYKFLGFSFSKIVNFYKFILIQKIQ